MRVFYKNIRIYSANNYLARVKFEVYKPELYHEFIDIFYFLKEKYCYFLQEKNEFGNYKFKNLTSSFRSIKTIL